MKAFALFLTMIVVSSTGTARGAEYYQPAYPQQANAWQPQFQASAGYAPPPVAYAAPPQPVYYASPPVVYYAPAPPPAVYYAPPPVAYGGYGYDPYGGGVNLMFSFNDSSGHDHHDNGGGYDHGGYVGNYGHGGRNGHGNGRSGNYGRGGGHGGNYGHGSSGLGGIVNGVLGGRNGHGAGKGHDYTRIAGTVFGRKGNLGDLFRSRH